MNDKDSNLDSGPVDVETSSEGLSLQTLVDKRLSIIALLEQIASQEKHHREKLDECLTNQTRLLGAAGVLAELIRAEKERTAEEEDSKGE